MTVERKTSRLDRRVKRTEVKKRYAMSESGLRNALQAGAFPLPHSLPGAHHHYWWESALLEYEKRFK